MEGFICCSVRLGLKDRTFLFSFFSAKRSHSKSSSDMETATSEAMSLHEKADALLDEGDYSESLLICEKALKEKEGSATRGQWLNLAATCCEFLREGKKMLKYALELVEWTERKDGKKCGNYAVALRRKAKSLELLGRLTAARKEIDVSIDLLKKLEEWEPLAMALRSKAGIFYEQKVIETASENYDTCFLSLFVCRIMWRRYHFWKKREVILQETPNTWQLF